MIKDSDRKILWARAGNKCTMCDTELTMTAENGRDIVVGQEAHIISEKPNGPRHRDLETYDSYKNFILLCPTHHSVIDKDPEDYSVELLQSIKNKHEIKLSEHNSSKSNFNWVVYTHRNLKLRLIFTGSELMNIMYGAESANIDHDEPSNEEEEGLISSFLNQIEDWDVLPDLPISMRPGLQRDMTSLIQSLMHAGFVVIGTREKTRAKFQDSETPWTIAHVSIVRASGSKIAEAHMPDELKDILEKVKAMSPEEIKRKLKSIESGIKERKSTDGEK